MRLENGMRLSEVIGKLRGETSNLEFLLTGIDYEDDPVAFRNLEQLETTLWTLEALVEGEQL